MIDKHKLACLIHPSSTRLGERGHIYWDDISGQPRILDRILMLPTAYFMDWEGNQIRKEDVSGLSKDARIAYWRVQASCFLSQLEWKEIDEGTTNYILDMLGDEDMDNVIWSQVTENEQSYIISLLQRAFLESNQ